MSNQTIGTNNNDNNNFIFHPSLPLNYNKYGSKNSLYAGREG